MVETLVEADKTRACDNREDKVVIFQGALKKFRDRLSPPGAAPLLGLNGIVLKCHGGAGPRDVAEALRVAADLAQSDFAAEIERNMTRLPAALA